MSDFTAKDVKALRDATGAGMMDAKKALTEAGGDAEAATQILREKGLSKAAKRSDRENTEGAVAIAQDGNKVAVVLHHEVRARVSLSGGVAGPQHVSSSGGTCVEDHISVGLHDKVRGVVPCEQLVRRGQ